MLMSAPSTDYSVRSSPRLSERPAILFINNKAFELGCITKYMEQEFPDYLIIGLTDATQIDTLAIQRVAMTIVDLPKERLRPPEVAQLTADLSTGLPETAVAITTNSEDDLSGLLSDMVDLRGVISSAAMPGVVVAIIRLILAGGEYFPRNYSASRSDDSIAADGVTLTLDQQGYFPPQASSGATAFNGQIPPAFTPRESQILAQLAQGLPNKLIAAALGMPENTVKVHVRNLMRKLKATNRTAAVVAAQRLNIFDDMNTGRIAS